MAARIPDLETFVIDDFRLQSGTVMPAVTIAYRTLGALEIGRASCRERV